jgi:hypothetical protein
MIKIVILHVIKCIEWASQSTFLLLINIFFSPAYLCFIYIEFIFVWRLFSITAKVRGGAVRLLKNNCLRGAYARLFSSRDFRPLDSLVKLRSSTSGPSSDSLFRWRVFVDVRSCCGRRFRGREKNPTPRGPRRRPFPLKQINFASGRPAKSRRWESAASGQPGPGSATAPVCRSASGVGRRDAGTRSRKLFLY